LHGKWLGGDIAQCKRYCLEAPPEVFGASEGLAHCVPTEAGGFCRIDCQAGYLESGDLMCDIEQQKWSPVACEPADYNHAFKVTQSFDVKGLHCSSSSSAQTVAEALASAVARYVGLAQHLFRAEIQAAAEPPQAEAESTRISGFGNAVLAPIISSVILSVRCASEESCAVVRRRLGIASRGLPGLAAAIARRICEVRCLAPGSAGAGAGASGEASLGVASGGGDSVAIASLAACMARCPEAGGRLQLLYADEAKQDGP